MATIAVLGTLDTKGAEHEFIAHLIRRRGHDALLIDVGTGGKPSVQPDITRAQVASAAGTDLNQLVQRGDRGECVTAMAEAVAALIPRLLEEGRIDGVISLGGGGGTAIATAGMRALPIGFPKLMVSTLASGDTAPYIGTKDIVMMPSVVDVAGLNRISQTVFARAVGAICGMVEAGVSTESAKPLIVASMFGNTTDCVNTAKAVLEDAGYEVLVFHATGTGGRAMEDLIASGMVAGVLDVTTTELADELVGGILSAGPCRLDAAGVAGIPVVIAPGCLDMVNFGSRDSVPTRFKDRLLYEHNPQVTLMRTSTGECQELGVLLGKKVEAYSGPVAVMIPARAISLISSAGQPFHDASADNALFESIKRSTKKEIVTLDYAINDAEFSRACAEKLLSLIASTGKSGDPKPSSC